MCVKKLEIDGKVAVIISPNYGAGWSTWADDKHKLFMLFDYDLATAVLEGNYHKVVQLVLEHDPTIYVGGAQDLKVVWVKKGTEFRVEEHDGFESIVMKGASMKDYTKELDELKNILFTLQNGLTAVSYQLDALKSEIASSKPSEERDYYPRYFKARDTTSVVKFDSLNTGTIVVGSEHYNEGEFDDCWVDHTDTNHWIEIPYNEELGIAHGQLCECWDDDGTHKSELRFYDAINKRTFTYCGVMDNGSYKFEHYHPLTFAEYPERLKQAALTLDLGV